MSSLGGSTVSSSYDRLLILPAGGGNGATMVQISDGDAGTDFALRLSDEGIAVGAGDKIFLDGGGTTYLTESSDGVLDIYSNGLKYISANASGNLSNQEVVINEDGHNIDFRVQSDTKTHSLIIDGNSGWVGINNPGANGYPESYLHIKSNDRTDPHILCESSNANGFRLLADRYTDTYATDGETQLNLGISYSSASAYLASKVYGSTSVDYDGVGGWVSSTDAGAYKGSAILLDGGDGQVRFYAGETGTTVAKGSAKTMVSNVTVTSGGIALGGHGVASQGVLDVRGKSYFQGIGRTYVGSVTIDGSGNIDLPSTNGPVFVVSPNVGGGADDLDSITIDGATPADGTRIWLMKTGTGAEAINIRTGLGAATAGDNAIEGTTNLEDNDEDTGGLDGKHISAATIASAYAVLPLMYRASTTARWLIMDASMLSNVTVID